MKKLIAITAAVCMLCACGEVEDEGTAVSSKESSESSSVTTTEAATTTEAVSTAESAEATYDKTEASVPWTFENGEPYERPYDKVSVVGKLSEDTDINEYTSNVLHNGVVGLVGTPFVVQLDAEESDICFVMTDKALESVPLENLLVLRYNEDKGYYEELETEHDADSGTVSAKITERGVYMLVDRYIWGAAWGEDTSGFAHDTMFQSDEFGFEVTIPAGIICSEVSSSWETKASGMDEKVMLHQNDDGEVKVTMTGMRFTEEVPPEPLSQVTDEILETLSSLDYGFTVNCHEKTEFDIGGGRKGYLMMYDFYDSESGKAMNSCVSGFYEYSTDVYIVLSYNADGEMTDALREKLSDAVRSFGYTDK